MALEFKAPEDAYRRIMHETFNGSDFHFVMHDMSSSPSDNQFKSGIVYGRNGEKHEWRNYAIIKTEEREFKAPILMEE